jgi:WD40 repeat protein
LALDPRAGRLYALRADPGDLTVLEAGTLESIGRLQGVQRVLAAPGSGRFYALTEDETLVAHDTLDLGELGRLPVAEVSPSTPDHTLHHNPATDELYAAPLLSGAGHTPIQVRDGETLQLEAEVVVPGSVRDLAVDARANRFFVATDDQLIAVDGESLAQVARELPPVAVEGTVRDMGVDPATGRLHLWGDTFLGPDFWLVVDAASLETLYEHGDTPGWGARALDGEGNLLAVRAGGEVVSRLDPETGAPLPGEAGRLVLGIRLLAALPHPLDGRLYVVDSGGGLQVLDGPALQVLESWPALLPSGSLGLTQPGEVALALDPAAHCLYVADLPAVETLALDLEALELVGRVPAAGHLAVDAGGGRLFVARGNVHVFDTETFSPEGSAEGEPAISYEPEPGQSSVPSFWAGEVTYDAAGQRLLVRSEVGGSVHVAGAHYDVYDGETLAPLGGLSVDQPNGYLRTPVLLPESDRIVAAYTSGGRCTTGRGPLTWDCRQGLLFFGDDLVELGQIRGLSGRFLTGPDGRPGPDGALYLWRGSHLLALDRERAEPLAELALEGEIWDMVLAPGQGQIYRWAWDRLAALPTTGLLDRVPTRLADPPALEGGDFVYPSPNVEEEDTLFAAIPAAGLYRSTGGGDTWQLAAQGLLDYYLGRVLFSPDYEQDGTLFVEVDGARTYRSSDRGETWRPDGPPRLAFVSDRKGDKDVYVTFYDPEIAPLNAGAQRLTDDPAQDDNPAWSPGGDRLVFQSDRSGNHDLWTVNWDGSGLAQLTRDLADDLLPAWSPDGGQIAFVSLRDGNPEIYLMRAPGPGQEGDASTVQRLTDHPAGDWRPAWSPDGTQIAFASTRDGDNEIYVLSVAGAGDGAGGVHQLTDDDADDRDPAWMPGGEARIYFSSDRAGSFDIYSLQPGKEGLVRHTGTPYNESHVAVGLNAGGPFFVSDQTGNADLYHGQREPYVRRLTAHPAQDTAPAWNPYVPVAPQAPRPRPSPTATPRPPLPTPAATRAATPAAPAPAPAPGLPTLSGTPLPASLPVLSPENASSVVEVGHWGGGKMAEFAYAPGGRLVAVAAEDGIYLYDGENLKSVGYARVDVPVEHLAFSPDGRTLATEWGAAVRLWDVSACGASAPGCLSVAGTLEGHGDRVRCLAFSLNGEMLATGSLDETVRLWRLPDGYPLLTVEMPQDRPGSLSWVVDLALSPDGEILAVALFDNTVRLFRVDDGQLLHTLDREHYWSTRLAFSPDGALLVTAGQKDPVQLWRVADGQRLGDLDEHGRPVLSLVFQDPETLLTTTDDNVVRTWDISGCATGADGQALVPSEGCGTLLRTLDEGQHSVSNVAFGPGGARWVTFNQTNVLRMWRASDGERVAISLAYTGWIRDVAFHPDGSLLVAVAYDDLYPWRVADGRLLDILFGNDEMITSLAPSPDGSTLATASEDATVRLWAVPDWEVRHTLEGHSGAVLDVAFTPGSQILASAGKDGTLRLWRTEDGGLLHTLEGGVGPRPSVAVSPDGALLASGADDGSVGLWALEGCGDPVGPCGCPVATLTGHSLAAVSLAFSPGGDTLASGSEDGTVRLWALGECPKGGAGCGRRLGTLTGHQGDVEDVVFAPGGRLLVSSSDDGKLRLWDVSACAAAGAEQTGGCGQLLHTLDGGAANSVALSPDGTLLASDGSWAVQMWGVAGPGE